MLFKAPSSSVNSLICILTDRTGIVDHKICMFVFCHYITDLLQNTDQLFTVPRIHLTAKGHRARSQRTSQFFCFLFQDGTGFFHKIILSLRFFLWLRTILVNVL